MTKSLTARFALAFLALVAARASGQLAPAGPERLLSSGPASCALMAAAADGSFALAWVAWNGDGRTGRLLVQVVDSNDVPLPARELGTVAFDTVRLDALRANPHGFALQWLDSSGPQRQTRVQQLDLDGQPSGAQLVAAASPRLSPRPVGGYVATQLDRRGLQVQLRDALGVRVGSATSIGDLKVVDWTVLHRPDGQFTVLYWSARRQGRRTIDLGVRAVWFGADGKALSKAKLVVPPWARSYAYGLGPDGTLAVSYHVAERFSGMWLATFDGRSRALARPALVLPGRQHHTLAVDEHGEILLVWTDAGAGGMQVWAQLFSARIMPLGATIAVPEPTPGVGPGAECLVATDAGASWVVSWLRGRRAPDFELRFRRFDDGT